MAVRGAGKRPRREKVQEGGVAKRKEILLRISPELWEEIARWAADELRSVNGHIEYVLREAVRTRRGGGASRARGGSRPPAGEERT
jgi:hypothetical protein